MNNLTDLGQWIEKPAIKLVRVENVPVVECSRCGVSFSDLINNHKKTYRYCPACGKRMENNIL